MSLLSACSEEQSNQPLTGEMIFPEMIEANKQAKIEAVIRYGNEYVNNADKAYFKIRESEESGNIEEVNSKSGVKPGHFYINKNFESKGTYFVTFYINSGEKIYEETRKINVHDHSDEENAAVSNLGDENSESQSEVDMHFMKQQNSEETTLIVHLTNNKEELKDANVRFEIWKQDADENEKHNYLDAKEGSSGEYIATTKLDSQNYIVRIHVEKEDIHTHKDEELILSKS